MQQVHGTSDLEVARIMERRTVPHIYRNDLPPPPAYDFTIWNPGFVMPREYDEMDHAYPTQGRDWYAIDEYKYPPVATREPYEGRDIESIIAMLPSRETDILDDFIESSSGSASSVDEEVENSQSIVTLHQADGSSSIIIITNNDDDDDSSIGVERYPLRQISDEDVPISALISKHGWLGSFDNERTEVMEPVKVAIPTPPASVFITNERDATADRLSSLLEADEEDQEMEETAENSGQPEGHEKEPEEEEEEGKGKGDEEEEEEELGFLADSRDTSVSLDSPNESEDASGGYAQRSIKTDSDEHDDAAVDEEDIQRSAKVEASPQHEMKENQEMTSVEVPEQLVPESEKGAARQDAEEVVVEVEEEEAESENGHPDIDRHMRARWRWAILSQNRDLVFSQVRIPFSPVQISPN